MQDRIEPPVLLSRLMTFVFAAALVILFALFFTLSQMFPLDRPQVFFLTTQPRGDLSIQMHPLDPDESFADAYKRAFVKEYIKARNEIIPNAKVMLRKWGNQEDGIVNAWSSPDVYADFVGTNMWELLMQDGAAINFRCPVDFYQPAIEPYARDAYLARFSYTCTNNDGQTAKKDYKIVVRLETDTENKVKWGDHMNSPLGVRVAGYEVISGNGDPLNF